MSLLSHDEVMAHAEAAAADFSPPHPDDVAAPGQGGGMHSTCVGCGGADDHNAHQIDVGGGQSVFWHHDCHARATPACPICFVITHSHGGTLKGEELRAHIIANDPAAAVAAELNERGAAAGGMGSPGVDEPASTTSPPNSPTTSPPPSVSIAPGAPTTVTGA